MKTIISVLVLGAVGCGNGNDEAANKAIVAKVEHVRDAMCACKDEGCAIKVQWDLDDLEKRGDLKKPTGKQLTAVNDGVAAIQACKKKQLLDDAGDALLKKLDASSGAAHQQAENNYAAAIASCNMADLNKFKSEYPGVAAGNQATFVKAYEEYCTIGMHVDVIQSALYKAELGHDCSSPNFALAEEQMNKAPGGPEKLAPLKQRWTTACPAK